MHLLFAIGLLLQLTLIGIDSRKRRNEQRSRRFAIDVDSENWRCPDGGEVARVLGNLRNDAIPPYWRQPWPATHERAHPLWDRELDL